MEKFTRMRDVDELIRNNYSILKEYKLLSGYEPLIVEYINDGNDTISNIFYKVDNEYKLKRERIKINTNEFRTRGLEHEIFIDYDINADNYLNRVIGKSSIPKTLKMIAPNKYMLEDFDPINVNYFYGSNQEAFSKINDLFGLDISVLFEDSVIIKLFNYDNRLVAVNRGEPILEIVYTDKIFDRMALKMINYEQNTIVYITKIKDSKGYTSITGSTKFLYEKIDSNIPFVNTRFIEINDIPIMAKYDEYGEPLEYNHQESYLGEFEINEESARVYLYNAYDLNDRDIIYSTYGFDNIFYYDILTKSHSGRIGITRRLILRK